MTSQDLQSTSRLEIYLLGRFEIYIDGEPLPETEIKGRKARSLLKILAHHRQHRIVRDQLSDLIWPHLGTDAAASQLYKSLHHLRKAFSTRAGEAENWIEITDNLVRLCPPGDITTDVYRLELAAKEGLRDRNISKLELAESLFTGDFLPMDRYAAWSELPREHYRQLYLDVLTTLSSEYEQRGKLSDAAEMLRLSLEKEPALETAHRGLMRIFAKQGQITRGYRQYDRCREILKEELGVSPSPETRQILDDIREGRLALKEKQSTGEMLHSLTKTPIIGREKALKLLNSKLAALSDGQGDSVVITGEVGMGKTRLIRELTVQARQKNISYFLGYSSDGAHSVGYSSFIDLFKDLLHQQPEAKELLPAEFRQLVPGLSGGKKEIPYADKLAAKSYLFAQIHECFRQQSSQQPLLIIMEDFHAADSGSRELYSYLVHHGGDLPVLFIATCQSQFDEDLSGSRELGETVELTPLTFEQHLSLLHHYSASSGVAPETAEFIYRLSEGNPLYAIELLRYYSNVERKTGRPAEKLPPAADISQNMPSSLRTPVEQQLSQLPPAARHLLNIAAVIGRRVPYELLASVWKGGQQAEENILFDALEEVIRLNLLQERGLDYSFRHALVREVVYASVSLPRRQVLHRLIAEQLVSISDPLQEEPVKKIAHHFLNGGEVQKGARYLMKAGERAEKVYAHEDALQSYRETIEALSALSDHEAGDLKREVMERTGDVYRACGKLEKSYHAYEQAIEFAETTGSDSSVELYRKMAVVAILRTEIDRSEHYLSKAFERVDGNPRTRARLLITKALHLWHQNRLEEAYDTAQQALQLARKAEAPAEASQACEILAMTCLPLGWWEKGLEYEMQRQVYGWSPEIVVATDAHLCLWEYHVSGKQPMQKARSFLEEVSRQAKELGDLRCVAVCHYALGTMFLWRGERGPAVDQLSASLKLHEQVGSPAGMAYSLARKGVLHTLMGALELGWQAIQEGLSHASRAAVRDHCLQRLYGVGIWNRLEAGRPGQALGLVEQSEQLLEESGACAACALELYPWLSYYYLKTGDIEKVKSCGEAVSELAGKTGNPIGKAIAAMIESSLYRYEKNERKAQESSRKSYDILKDAVSETTHSPVTCFLERMNEQNGNIYDS